MLKTESVNWNWHEREKVFLSLRAQYLTNVNAVHVQFLAQVRN
jgi:hypothetical protein